MGNVCYRMVLPTVLTAFLFTTSARAQTEPAPAGKAAEEEKEPLKISGDARFRLENDTRSDEDVDDSDL